MIYERPESIILNDLLNRLDFAKLVIPHVNKRFFKDVDEQIIFESIASHICKFDALPTEQAMVFAITQNQTRTKEEDEPTLAYLQTILKPTREPDALLKATAQDFIRDQGYRAYLWDAIEASEPTSKHKKDRERFLQWQQRPANSHLTNCLTWTLRIGKLSTIFYRPTMKSSHSTQKV